VTGGRVGALGAHLLGCSLVLLVGCAQDRPAPPGKGDAGIARPVPRASRVRPLVMRLSSQDEKTVAAARVVLRRWTGDKAPSVPEAVELLRASGGTFPLDKADGGSGVASEIMQVLAATPRPEYRAVIEDLFPRLSRSAREAALILLSVIDDQAAAESFVRLLRAHAAETSDMFELQRLRDKPHHADVFFPALLDLTKHDSLADELYLTALIFCDEGQLSREKLAPRTASLLAAYRTERDWLRPKQRPRGLGWMWTDDYQRHRNRAALLLDLAGYLPAKDVARDLTEALAFRDPRLVYFALTSLLENDGDLSPAAVAAVAASSELRNHLYEKLKEADQDQMMPPRYRTQAAFAEAEMVRWLVYPTELGRVPDQIELKKVVSVDAGGTDGVLDYYLFRFRTLPPHWAAKEGWMAGVAGPFLRKDTPTTEAQGDTFSEFERWNSRTPAEHVGDVRELLEDWRKRRDKDAAQASE
jgi:hypothetical protein